MALTAVSGSVSHPTATQMRVGLRTVLDEGWLAFDSIKLASLSAPIAVRPGQDHTLAAQVSGQLEGANAARLFIRYSDGTIVTIWQNESGFTGSQNVSGDFITPAGVGNFQVGTEVSLDQGHLSLTTVTLTAYSAAFPVTAGDDQFTGQVTGALAASLGQGGRITAVYTDSEGHGETLLWQNPANFNGTTTVQRTFTGNASGAPTRLALTANLAAGHLAFGDVDLQYLADGDIIQRSTYMLAGQAVAVRVSGDPEGHDGLYYLYSDHLGSATAVTYGLDGNGDPHPQAGQLVGEVTRYYPFGGYREGSGPNEVTDRGYTGHKHNDYIKLIDMRARWYDPAIGRFISPDPIIPDPTNPQSLNRYSYVYNNPVRYTDSSGHCVDGITTWVCIAAGIAIVTKVIDYGITAWDTYQAGRTLADPTASGSAKMMAGLTVGLSILFEAIEPDDILPIGLPADDVARRAILNGAEEVLEEGGPEALEGFLRNQLGDHADDVLAKLDELLGIDNVRFHEDPGQLQHIFRDKTGHLLEDTVENRNLLLDTVSHNNFMEVDQHGNQVFARVLDNGTEVWVQIRDGIIQNGGLNQIPTWIKN